MKTYTISKLAKEFGLSRSTLLYYDRIGLFKCSGRTTAGYRYYTDKDYKTLERICNFREAGLTLEEIQQIIASGKKPHAKVLENRLREIGDQIQTLKNQQQLLTGMLKQVAAGTRPKQVDKRMWVEMLRAAGMDDEAMARWHAEFEQRAPEAHQEFLLSINIPEREVIKIRK